MSISDQLDPNITINHAIALLMRENACVAQVAAELLRQAAHDNGLTLYEVAIAIVDLATP